MLQFNQSIKESYSTMKLLSVAGDQIHQLLKQDVTVFQIEAKKVMQSASFELAQVRITMGLRMLKR